MTFPAAIPEVPTANIADAIRYYVDHLRFTIDFPDYNNEGIAGISRGACRLFLTDLPFREPHGNLGPIVLWINLTSRAEVDALHAEWKSSGAILLSAPEDKPWLLHEFLAADPDHNRIRVFYDFHAEQA